MSVCANCGEEMEVGSWPFCRSRANPDGHGSIHRHDAVQHTSEMTVLWENPKTGDVRWPGRNDRPVPQYYAREGFERREYRSIHDVKRIERQHKVMSERLNFDRSGHADEG